MAAVWGTWEELLLGGAVLRHGTGNWIAVASEIRDRTNFPHNFTPEVCKTKYEELQRHYSGHIALFEELRKQRVAELKRSLEQSDDSIGSLQSKLRNLEAEKRNNCHIDYGSGQTESPTPFQKSDGVESSGKESSKDGLSAGSFTHETRKNWSSKRRIPLLASSYRGMNPGQENAMSMDNPSENKHNEQGGNIRRRRGKRKRKDGNKDIKEGSVGESDFLGPVDSNIIVSRSKENSTTDDGHAGGFAGLNSFYQCSSREGTADIMGIFECVVNKENASPFCCRHDSQKRARYKNLIKQHMDFDTIRSRIAKHTVKSTRELFRDLLLLVNNALIFYSKSTREHKSALLLRDHIMKLLRQNEEILEQKTAVGHRPAVFFMSPISNAPVKARSARPRKEKQHWTKTGGDKKFVAWSLEEKKESGKIESLPCREVFVNGEREIPVKKGKRGQRR